MTNTSKISLVLSAIFGLPFVHCDLICLSDLDCAKPDTYCYQTGVCANCTECRNWHRYPGNGCAKNKDQCGDCYSGMIAETNIDGTLSVCRPGKATTKLPIKDEGPNEVKTNDNIWFILPPCIILPLIILITFCLVKPKCPRYCKRIGDTYRSMRLCSLMTNRDCERDLEYSNKNTLATAPPFDDTTRPQNPPLYSEICQPVEHGANQTATPFANPSYATNRSFPAYSEDPDEEITEHDTLMPEPRPENEETMPSNWTPSPDATNVDSSSAQLTFENSIASLQNLNIAQPDGTVVTLQNQQSSSGATTSNSTPNQSGTQTNAGNAHNYEQNVTQTQINININSGNIFQGRFA